MRKLFALFLLGVIPSLSNAQFHTVKVPRQSPKVSETQRLGITDITVDYHSPAVRGRDIWKEVVGSYGDPNLAWRAGANMNTVIKFTTDVMVEGKVLAAGSYGFHIDTKQGGPWTLMFAHHDNQWGSYYLDREKHVTLSIEVNPVEITFSEQLDYRFINRTDSCLVVALEWGEKQIPFTVSVDLNETVLSNFRYELLGINTYRWEAWDDAARWCYDRNTNLEEGLAWANRSINGGYTGFASNKNFRNLSTKARLLLALEKQDEFEITVKEMAEAMEGIGDVYWFGTFLIDKKQAYTAEGLYTHALDKFGDDNWVMTLGLGRAQFANGNSKAGNITMEKAFSMAPERSKDFAKSQIESIKD